MLRFAVERKIMPVERLPRKPRAISEARIRLSIEDIYDTICESEDDMADESKCTFVVIELILPASVVLGDLRSEACHIVVLSRRESRG